MHEVCDRAECNILSKKHGFLHKFQLFDWAQFTKAKLQLKFVFLFQDSLSEFSIIDYMINIYNIINNTINDY